MSAPANGVNFPIGSMTGLTNTQYQYYTSAVAIFNRVQAYNLAIQNARTAGNKKLSYYTFADNTERMMFNIGQTILIQNDPINAINYYTVQDL